MPWMIKETDGEYCVHKKTGEKVACHATREKAEAQMRALYAGEMHANSMYLLDNYVSTKPGEPFRLFPFGRVIKNGVVHNITREYAAKFRLPHFKPPIKLGSHDETTPAGGHIVDLEVRDDGLYAVPEVTDKGAQALFDGSYRYQSPEVIWEDGGMENPITGEMIPGPLIVGDALLHMPHLGEAAALYSVEPMKEHNMETVEVPKSFWEQFMARIFPKLEDMPTAPPAPVKPSEPSDEFKAAVKERDDYKAKLQTLEAERKHTELIATIRGEFVKTEFGSTYIELGKADETAQMLAGMTEEQRSWCVRNFAALSKQISTNDAITHEIGSGAANTTQDPIQAYNAAIEAEKTANKLDFAAAMTKVNAEHPELYQAYAVATRKK